MEILQAEKRYERIYESFHVLYNLAHVTRYSAKPERWIPATHVNERVVRQLVYPLETSVRKLLAKASPPVELPEVEKLVFKPSGNPKGP